MSRVLYPLAGLNNLVFSAFSLRPSQMMFLCLPSGFLKEKTSWVKKDDWPAAFPLPEGVISLPCHQSSGARPAPERWWSMLKVLLCLKGHKLLLHLCWEMKRNGSHFISSSWNGCILQENRARASASTSVAPWLSGQSHTREREEEMSLGGPGIPLGAAAANPSPQIPHLSSQLIREWDWMLNGAWIPTPRWDKSLRTEEKSTLSSLVSAQLSRGTQCRAGFRGPWALPLCQQTAPNQVGL